MTLEGSGGQPHSPLGTRSTPRAPLLKGKQAPGWLWEVGDPEPWDPLEQVDPPPQISGPIRFDAKGQRAPRQTGMGVLETCALPSAPQPWLALPGAPGDAQWSHFCTKSGACDGRPARFGGSLACLWTPWGWTVGGRAGWLSCLCPRRPHPASPAPGAKEELGQGRGNAGTRGVCSTASLRAAGAPGLCPELRAARGPGPAPCPPPRQLQRGSWPPPPSQLSAQGRHVAETWSRPYPTPPQLHAHPQWARVEVRVAGGPWEADSSRLPPLPPPPGQ